MSIMFPRPPVLFSNPSIPLIWDPIFSLEFAKWNLYICIHPCMLHTWHACLHACTKHRRTHIPPPPLSLHPNIHHVCTCLSICMIHVYTSHPHIPYNSLIIPFAMYIQTSNRCIVLSVHMSIWCTIDMVYDEACQIAWWQVILYIIWFTTFYSQQSVHPVVEH